jgi:hypothetical protein
MWVALAVLVLVALLVLVVGGLLGVFLGGIVGGVRGSVLAKEDDEGLATYRGATWGGCLGAVVGIALALVVVFIAWGYLQS